MPIFKRNAKSFSLYAIVDVCRRRHEIIILENYLGDCYTQKLQNVPLRTA